MNSSVPLTAVVLAIAAAAGARRQPSRRQMARGSGNAPTKAQVNDEVSRAIVKLLINEPYYGHLLGHVSRIIDPDITNTAAVRAVPTGVELIVNPDFFMGTLTSIQERTAVIKHEALHLLFKHLYRVPKTSVDWETLNIAADLVVNQNIGKGRHVDLPDWAVTLDTFPDLGLGRDLTMDQYYKTLIGLKNEIENAKSAQGGQAGGGQPGGGQPGDGQPGGGGGTDYSSTSAPQSAEALDRLLSDSGHGDDHSHWGKGEMSDAVAQASENKLADALRKAKERAGPRGWGSLPGHIQDMVDALIKIEKPKVDWRRALKIFAANSSRTRVATTSRRASRRFGTYPGTKIKAYSRIVVAVDTSGSVSDADLGKFWSEIQGMFRARHEIWIMEADADVQRVYRYQGRVPKHVAGRGGTRFNPVLEAVKNPQSLSAEVFRRPDGRPGPRLPTPINALIYLTDGEASSPTVRCPVPTLWVLTPDGTDQFIRADDSKCRGRRVIQLPD